MVDFAPPPHVISQVTPVEMCAEIKLSPILWPYTFLESTVPRRWQTVDLYSGLIDGLARRTRLKGVRRVAPLEVTLVTRLRAGWFGVWIQVVTSRDFCSSAKRPDRLWGRPGFLLSGDSVLYRGVKAPGREFDHTPPSRAQVNNEWSYTSASPVCRHGVGRENFTFAQLRIHSS
jgi:hypothetical protein